MYTTTWESDTMSQQKNCLLETQINFSDYQQSQSDLERPDSKGNFLFFTNLSNREMKKPWVPWKNGWKQNIFSGDSNLSSVSVFARTIVYTTKLICPWLEGKHHAEFESLFKYELTPIVKWLYAFPRFHGQV